MTIYQVQWGYDKLHNSKSFLHSSDAEIFVNKLRTSSLFLGSQYRLLVSVDTVDVDEGEDCEKEV